jgi:hypothetical protein
MNFRAILFGADQAHLDAWLTETNASGPHHIRSFAQFMSIEGGALRLRKSQLMAASQVNASAKSLNLDPGVRAVGLSGKELIL